MRSAFGPATRFLDRMRYRSKFILLGSVVCTVMLVLMASVYTSLHRDIVVAQKEMAGLEMLVPFNRAIQSIQQHRGLAVLALNGDGGARGRRAAVQGEVAKALEATEQRLSPGLRDKPAWREIRAAWSKLAGEATQGDADSSLKRHGELLAKARDFMIEVSDETELTLDPIMDTYYLMDSVVVKLPAILEALGQARDRGVMVTSEQNLTLNGRRELMTLVAQLEDGARAQGGNLRKIVQFSDSLGNELPRASADFENGIGKVVALLQGDILGERFAMPATEYYAKVSEVVDGGYRMMNDALIRHFEERLKAREAAAARELYLDFGLALLALLAVIWLGVGFYYSVMASVESFSQGARRLAEGDLGVRFPASGVDELHDAARDFDRMAETFRHLMGTLKGDVIDLQAAAQQLAASSQHITQSSATQSDAASSMAASVQQMTVGVDNITHNALEVQDYSGKSEATAANGVGIVDKVVSEISLIAETVNQSAVTIEELGRHSEQISAIVGTIKEIADQTNLLALNAAIEAARAGETGRGFAVVADEVRKLAERTTLATQEIAGMIRTVQTGTSDAVVSMKMGVERVAVGVAEAQRAGETIGQVQQHTQRVLEAISEITGALREQSSASTDIAKNVERIARMADENHSDVRDNAATAAHLRELADDLNAAVAHFRI